MLRMRDVIENLARIMKVHVVEMHVKRLPEVRSSRVSAQLSDLCSIHTMNVSPLIRMQAILVDNVPK